jgi:hypothetical protein
MLKRTSKGLMINFTGRSDPIRIRNDMINDPFRLEVLRYELLCDLAAKNCLVGPNVKLNIGRFGNIESSINGSNFDA